MNKKEIRNEILSKRANILNSEKELFDEKILRYLKDTTEYKRAKNIFIYIGYNSEINTSKYIEELLKEGKNILVPRTNYTGKFMEAVQIKSLERLEKDKFGILEPPFNKKASSKEKIDLVILPGVAFDKNGGRIGYGGGYYDKYLADIKEDVAKVALCYYVQIIESVPMEEHDIRADKIITEKGIIL